MGLLTWIWFPALLDADINLGKKINENVSIADAGKGSFRISVHDLIQIQIRRDDCRFVAEQALVDTQKKLGSCKGIAKFCSEVVNYQQIAVKDVMMGSYCIRVLLKHTFA